MTEAPSEGELSSLFKRLDVSTKRSEENEEKSDKRGSRDDHLKIRVAYVRNYPYFTNHKYIGVFSMNDNLEYNTDSSFRYLHLPKQLHNLNVSLDGGFEQSRCFSGHLGQSGYKKYRKARNEHYLRWIKQNGYTSNFRDRKRPIFVAISGNISKLMMTPYTLRYDWTLNAARHENIIFIDMVSSPTQEDYEINSRKDPKQFVADQRASFHGPKFVQLMTSKSKSIDTSNDHIASLLNEPLSTYEKNHHIFEVDFGSHSLLCVIEIEAFDPSTEERVEFRVVKSPLRSKRIARFQSLKMWTRAVVADISKTVIGARRLTWDRNGFLEEIKTSTIEDLEQLGRDFWSAPVCYNFLDRVLNFVKANIPENDFDNVYQFSWALSEDKICKKILNDGSILIPQWFRN